MQLKFFRGMLIVKIVLAMIAGAIALWGTLNHTATVSLWFETVVFVGMVILEKLMMVQTKYQRFSHALIISLDAMAVVTTASAVGHFYSHQEMKEAYVFMAVMGVYFLLFATDIIGRLIDPRLRARR